MSDIFEPSPTGNTENPERRAQELSKRELPKRFYKHASHAPIEGGFCIQLDGRPVKTPGRMTLLLPSENIAKAVAAEWDAQTTRIDPTKMPLTRIANSAQEAVAVRFEEVADDLTRFAGNDALCYRAESPDGLVARQTEILNPVLNWAGELLGGRFSLIAGVIHAAQPEELLAAFRGRLDRLSPLQLAALHTATTLSGSALLALALAEAYLTPDAAWTAAHVEEDWNIERWGEDAEAQQVRGYKRREFDAAALILAD